MDIGFEISEKVFKFSLIIFFYDYLPFNLHPHQLLTFQFYVKKISTIQKPITILIIYTLKIYFGLVKLFFFLVDKIKFNKKLKTHELSRNKLCSIFRKLPTF